MVRLYRTWVLGESVNDTGTTDVYQIYKDQRRQLENNVKALQEKLQKETRKHTQENKRILKENVQLIKELNQLRAEEQKLKIGVGQVLANIKAAGGQRATANTSVNFHSASGQSFAQKRQRVQSAVNTRTKDIAEEQREREEMMKQEAELTAELNEIRRRNEEIKMRIIAKREQRLAEQQFNQTEGDGGDPDSAPQYIVNEMAAPGQAMPLEQMAPDGQVDES